MFEIGALMADQEIDRWPAKTAIAPASIPEGISAAITRSAPVTTTVTTSAERRMRS